MILKTIGFWRWMVCLTSLIGPGAACLLGEDAIDRLKMDRLKLIHESISDLEKQRSFHRISRPYIDYRANLHVHSAFSHDSRGTIEEIVAAAKRAGTDILMFNEHPADHYDFYVDGHRGVRDGVLLIPGAEMKGFLVFPRMSMKAFSGAEKQELSNLVRLREGLTFVSHLEERMDWQIQGVTGCEIYNTHADFKTEKRLLASMKNPLWLIQAKTMFDRYPQESLSALLDYPSDYLQRWDTLCQIHPHTGVSANDAHQNVGLVVRWVDNKVRLEDALGEKLLEMDSAVYAAVQKIPKDVVDGQELLRIQLDPYACSLRHVGTHLLMKDLTEESVWEALNSGRAFVSFDWLANAKGFDFALWNQDQRQEMGSQVRWEQRAEFRAVAPHPVQWRLIRNGTLIHESDGETFQYIPESDGNYRIEAWLTIGSEKHIWILSNPIYVAK